MTATIPLDLLLAVSTKLSMHIVLFHPHSEEYQLPRCTPNRGCQTKSGQGAVVPQARNGPYFGGSSHVPCLQGNCSALKGDTRKLWMRILCFLQKSNCLKYRLRRKHEEVRTTKPQLEHATSADSSIHAGGERNRKSKQK